MREMEYSCANCGKPIPAEQPESIRGFCCERCKRQSEKEDLAPALPRSR